VHSATVLALDDQIVMITSIPAVAVTMPEQAA
jgi:hypothetical protein